MSTKPIDWAAKTDLDCIVICGGEGTRMLPMTLDTQKSTLIVNARPILEYVVEYWKKYCSRFIFIAYHKANQVERIVGNLVVPTELIVEEKAEGIAMALARAEGLVGDHFVTVLGDCLCYGEFEFSPSMSQGVGVIQARNPQMIHSGYSVRSENNRVLEVCEKPETLLNNDCGMGTYFFSKDVFKHIAKTEPSTKTGKIEITSVIQTMIDQGMAINRVPFTGDYVNVTFPSDLDLANTIALSINNPQCISPNSPVAKSQEKIEIYGKRTLLLRTTPLPMFKKIVAHIDKAIGDGRVDILSQSSVLREIVSWPEVNRVLAFPADGSFRIKAINGKNLKALRKERYDAVIIPYSVPCRTGYFHIEVLGKLIGGKCYGFIPPDELFELTWMQVIKSGLRIWAIAFERGLFYALKMILALRRVLFSLKQIVSGGL